MHEYIDKRLRLTELSVEIWNADLGYLSSATNGSAGTGFVDANNLVRAGEILDEIAREAAVLNHLSMKADPGHAEPIDTLRQRLVAIEHGLRHATRQLYSLT